MKTINVKDEVWSRLTIMKVKTGKQTISDVIEGLISENQKPPL